MHSKFEQVISIGCPSAEQDCSYRPEDCAASSRLLGAITSLQGKFIEQVPQHILFNDILQHLLQLTSSSTGFLAESLSDAAGNDYFKIQALAGIDSDKQGKSFFELHAPIGMEFDASNSMFRTVHEGKVIIQNNDIEKKQPSGHPELQRFLGLPVTSGGQVLGMIGLANGTSDYEEKMATFFKPLLNTCGDMIKAWRLNRWREEAEQDLHRHAMVFNNISDGVLLTNTLGIVIDANHSAIKMLERPLDAMVGRSLATLLSPDLHAMMEQGLQKVACNGRWSGKIALQGQDGHQHIFDVSSLYLDGVVRNDCLQAWFWRDITEEVQALSQLEQRTLELGALLDFSPVGYVYIDTTGKVAYVNPAFTQMCGLESEDVTGNTAIELESKIQALYDESELPSYLSQRERGALRITRPHFAILNRSSRSFRLPNNDEGQMLCFQDITRDVEVDRLKNEFLSTAAHELRTPMASVFGFSELLLTRTLPIEKQRQYIEVIHRQTGRLAEIINELLDLARIDAMEGKDFNISTTQIEPLLKSALDELLIKGDERKLKLQIQTPLSLVRIDPSKLNLVLTNILSNAYKYSFGQGDIVLRAFNTEQDGKFWVALEVEDHGVGMYQEQMDHVFERFWRADASGNVPGTGLGMALVKEIMDIFKGRIELKSDIGIGTRVKLWLPVSNDENQDE